MWTIVPAGERGLLLRVSAAEPSVAMNRALHVLAARVREVLGAELQAAIVGYSSIYVEAAAGNPVSSASREGSAATARLAEVLEGEGRALLGAADDGREGTARAGTTGDRAAGDASARTVTLPVLYGGERGPDLEDVARLLDMAPEEVVRRHADVTYHAFCLGFTPGFAYLGVLPPELRVPRLGQPRTRVPAGSVAIAGRQTGVYPAETPGGWRILGNCPVALHRPWEDPPVLVRPGDRVRFRPIDAATYEKLREEDRARAEAWRRRQATAAIAVAIAGAETASGGAGDRTDLVEVLRPGLLTTVQDLGRQAWRDLGFAICGAMDRRALRRANAFVGNAQDAAGLEITLAGPELRLRGGTGASGERTGDAAGEGGHGSGNPPRDDGGRWIAVAGADLGAEVDGVPIAPGEARRLLPGQTLRFRGRRRGARAYLAIEGGIDVPEVGGSRSTDLAAGVGGLGGRALAAGDLLPLGPARDIRRPGEARVASVDVDVDLPRGAASAGDARGPSETEDAPVPTVTGDAPMPTATGDAPPPAPREAVRVRALAGPDAGRVGEAALDVLFSSEWTVTPAANRMGMRLAGPALELADRTEMLSEPMPPGTVQVAADGTPMVLLADGHSTGGYPKIAVVLDADRDLLAQVLPGDRIRFIRTEA